MLSNMGRLTLALLCATVAQKGAEGKSMTTTVPAAGVYLVTLQVDPANDAELALRVNDLTMNVVAYGQQSVAAAVSVVVALEAGDRLEAKHYGQLQPNGHTTLGVAYVSNNTNDFTTVRSNGATSEDIYVPFHFKLVNRDRWVGHDPTNYVQIPKTGMYWVTARPDCAHESVELKVTPDLFSIICMGDQPVATSGAFRLQVGTRVQMSFISGNMLQGATFLSVVFLPFNQRSCLESLDHVAFTGWLGQNAHYGHMEKIAFDGEVKTDYGNLYDSQNLTWRIPFAGHYVLALRGGPLGKGQVKISVYNNEQVIFVALSDMGMESGQDGVFIFHKGAVISLKADTSASLTPRTMMSLALLKRHE